MRRLIQMMLERQSIGRRLNRQWLGLLPRERVLFQVHLRCRVQVR